MLRRFQVHNSLECTKFTFAIYLWRSTLANQLIACKKLGKSNWNAVFAVEFGALAMSVSIVPYHLGSHHDGISTTRETELRHSLKNRRHFPPHPKLPAFRLAYDWFEG
jgi:hypothetical protein